MLRSRTSFSTCRASSPIAVADEKEGSFPRATEGLEVSSPSSMTLGPVLPGGVRPALQCLGYWASSPVAPRGNMGHRYHHRSCGNTMDQDMALGCSSDSACTMAAQATQISMVPVAPWPLDINMTSGGGSNRGHPYGLWWCHNHGHQHRYQT